MPWQVVLSLWHVSSCVQEFPSLHEVPDGQARLWQEPLTHCLPPVHPQSAAQFEQFSPAPQVPFGHVGGGVGVGVVLPPPPPPPPLPPDDFTVTVA